jgi:hypothetical protein
VHRPDAVPHLSPSKPNAPACFRSPAGRRSSVIDCAGSAQSAIAEFADSVRTLTDLLTAASSQRDALISLREARKGPTASRLSSSASPGGIEEERTK